MYLESSKFRILGSLKFNIVYFIKIFKVLCLKLIYYEVKC